ncbi:MAG: LysE family translocator [Chloroflexi bacterium]|jgi:threonine/homoserine/homoserine lactone efflux protein|nr:LysE family translocator [Chloroflexota bacterium]
MPVPAFILGLTLAFALALPPSVILTETIRRGARGGFWPGVAVQYGSIVADCAYAFLGLAGAAVLVTEPVVQVLLGAFGVALMLWLGLTGMRAALRADEGSGAGAADAGASRQETDAGAGAAGASTAAAGGPTAAAGASTAAAGFGLAAAGVGLPGEQPAPGGRLGAALATRGPFLAGLALGLANPWAIAFWLGIGGTFAAAGLADADAADYAAFFVAYVTGLSIYSISVAALVGVGHRRLERRWLRVAEGLASAALLLFAAIFGVQVADLAIALVT